MTAGAGPAHLLLPGAHVAGLQDAGDTLTLSTDRVSGFSLLSTPFYSIYGGGPGRVDTQSGDHLLLSVTV